jgi:hypothetical protein
LRQQCALAFLADLRGEEGHTNVIRADASRGVHESRGVVHVVLEQGLLGGGEDPVQHAFQALSGARILLVAAEGEAVELRSVFARRRRDGSAPHRLIRARQEAFQLGIP